MAPHVPLPAHGAAVRLLAGVRARVRAQRRARAERAMADGAGVGLLTWNV